METPRQKNILILTAKNSISTEILVPYYVLKGLGFSVDIACPTAKKDSFMNSNLSEFNHETNMVNEHKGYKIRVDLDFSQVRPDSYDGLILPGGRAPEFLRMNKRAVEIADHFMEAKKAIGAFCSGAKVLLATGKLKGRKISAFKGLCENEFKCEGVEYVDIAWDDVFLDGNIVSTVDIESFPKFISFFLEVLGENDILKKFPRKKILILTENAAEMMELLVPYYAFIFLGQSVSVSVPGKKAGIFLKTTVQNYDLEGNPQSPPCRKGNNFPLNCNFETVNSDDYDAIYFPGGLYALMNLRCNEKILEIAKSFLEKNKLFGFLSHGIYVLASSNLLKDRKISAQKNFEFEINLAGGWEYC